MAVTLAFRNRLPRLVGLGWIIGTWYFVLGAPSLREMATEGYWGGVDSRYSELDLLGWLAMMLAAMVVVDRLLCRFADWRWGVDPMKVHFSKLRNRDGTFLCPACLGPFLLPPEDLDERAMVRCGDCGHGVAPYGEMKAHFPPEVAALHRSASAPGSARSRN